MFQPMHVTRWLSHMLDLRPGPGPGRGVVQSKNGFQTNDYRREAGSNCGLKRLDAVS